MEHGKGIVGEVSLSEASHSQTVKKLRHLAGFRLIFCVATILVNKDVNRGFYLFPHIKFKTYTFKKPNL